MDYINDDSITNAQIRKIWVEVKKQALNEDDLYALVGVFEKESLKNLTKAEAITLIDFLVQKSNEFKIEATKGMMTEAQAWKIEDYRQKLGWNTKALESFIKKYAHVDHTKWLTVSKASSIIEGLKNIYSRQVKSSPDNKTIGGR